MSDKQENSGQAPTDVSALRKRAEEQARSMEPTTSSTQPPEAIEQMLYELRVHQIELEMQNEELRTAQAEIEAGRARYFDLYDLAPVGYCTLSEKGLILEANLAAATLLGMARSTLIKQPISRFIPKEDQDIYYLHRKILFETGETQECELRMSRREGMSFWAHLKIAAAQQEDCVPVCRVVMSDITERVRMEAERKKLQTQLQQAQKMEAIGTLAGGIAHDFNNILMAIIGYAEMAQENSPAGSILRKDIDQIINASHRAREFVKKILVFSRQAETECTCFQPALILKENIDTLCSVLPSGITIQQDIDHEAGPIFADPMRIHQVMTNLCANEPVAESVQ